MGEVISIRTAESGDLDRVTGLLCECNLPTEGVEENLGKGYVIAEHGVELVGVCGIEVLKPFGLLRSFAVSRSWRGMSAGRALMDDRIAWARDEGIKALYLLTMGTGHYFEQFGFKYIQRNRVPPEIKGSLEFSSLCPETAVVMVKSLGDLGREESQKS
ncbi:MAG: GNAT family N-acetyltransferase [bacterium]|nr:MAG: GNAT family N-acetyltransferase [bacterium]